MSKKAQFGIVMAVLVTVAVGWFGYKSTTTRLYPGKITIGYDKWPGYIGFYIANEKGYFKEAGLNVEFKSYPSLTEIYSDYLSGKIQGAANLTMDVVNQVYAGFDQKIVLVMDYSSGSDGIIASPSVKRFADIKGKRVAFEHGTLEEYFLRYALNKNNINFSEIAPVNRSPEKAAEAVVNGEADVAVTYEPFMSAALLKSKGNKIYSSREAPGFITDILTFNSAFVKEHPDTIEVILRAYFKAIQFWKDNPNEAQAIAAKYLDSPLDQVATQLQGVSILDESDNRTIFTFAVGPESLYGNMRSIGEFVRAQQPKNNPKKVDTDSLIEPRFIRKIVR
ncbi:MAG: ABC transporter substrate-binding protein [Candidatus Magasanikbacteria bacterium]|nr:ABC transporter substrate-binding protein [Candidatus Magasanikbacteria bacterium]